MRLEARGVSAGYHSADVLHAISLHLDAGELVGLIGPNGSGKSTLLRVLTHALPARTGEVLLDGRPVSSFRARERARHIAFVPQTEPALFDFTAWEVVLMGRYAHVAGLAGEKEQDFEAARQAMQEADVSHLALRPITALSGGEHRRVLIARALAQQAPVLLLDEPTAHLDLSHQSRLLTVLRELVERDGTAVLAALHDLNLAAEFCDRLILLQNGRIAAEGAPGEVLQEAVLAEVYGAGLRVACRPDAGRPIVLPARVNGGETS